MVGIRARAVVGALVVCAALGGVGSASGQASGGAEVAIPEGLIQGFHIVRPRDNLRNISRDYLGSEAAWELNWRLNPEIVDPDFLKPGQRIRVLMRPESSVPSAQVVSLSGRVEGRPVPIGWNPAQREDIVVEDDGMRTFAQSSTALRFHDGTSLVMTEDSIVFLKRAGRTLQGVETRSVEIVEGQADLAAAATTGERPEIEFVIGDATARPRPGAAGSAEARLRKSQEGTAQLMVYEGESQLAAGGQTVAVEQGMGASVPEGAPPGPPEKLLPRPVLRVPAPGAALELGRLEFSWEPVDAAVGYSVEVCLDSACEALIARIVGVAEARWQAGELPLGDLHWRATATSPSGLDGYPADTRPFVVAPTRAEFDPPTAELSIAGISVDREGRRYHAPSIRVRVEVEDPSGVESWGPVIDGKPSGKPDLEGTWSTGGHRVSVVAEDVLGNRGETGALSFEIDGDGPEISWRVGPPEMLGELADGRSLEAPEARWWLRKAAGRNARRMRNKRPPDWTLVGWSAARVELSRTLESPTLIEGLYRNYRSLRVAGNSPRVLILAPGVFSDEASFLLVEAVDEMSGVEELSIRNVGSRSDGFKLEATARDRLGNTTRVELDFDLPEAGRRAR